MKHGRNRYLTLSVRDDMEFGLARRLLLEHGVGRSVVACFCNPNANCPVCGARVFYYQNEFGSRVFFNAPGAPWEKHGCTDSGKRQALGRGRIVERPTRRARGISLELLDAYQRVAARERGSLGGEHDQSQPHWTLIEINSVVRTGWRNDVVASFLGADVEELISFTFVSDVEVVQQGDIISLGHGEISLFRFDKDESRTYRIT
jgi:hypothetical protein